MKNINFEFDNLDFYKNLGSQYFDQYSKSKPFNHIVIDDFFDEIFLDDFIKYFPTGLSSNDLEFNESATTLKKRQYSPMSMHKVLRNNFGIFSSPQFLVFLEAMTGIKKIIPDPYYVGGGLHETLSGGKLGIHTDFRFNKKIDLIRKINVIVYLNKNWKSEYGGNLELYKKGNYDMPILSIAPTYNRMVVFTTDQESYHGQPQKLNTPDGISRKSIALYYYKSTEKIYNLDLDYETVWQSQSSDSNFDKSITRKIRMHIYRKNMFMIFKKFISKIFK